MKWTAETPTEQLKQREAMLERLAVLTNKIDEKTVVLLSDNIAAFVQSHSFDLVTKMIALYTAIETLASQGPDWMTVAQTLNGSSLENLNDIAVKSAVKETITKTLDQGGTLDAKQFMKEFFGKTAGRGKVN